MKFGKCRIQDWVLTFDEQVIRDLTIINTNQNRMLMSPNGVV